MHTLKPIDKQAIIEAAQQTGAIVTAEDHQVYGGLGSAVAEVVVKNTPVPMSMIAVNDSFGETGSPDELFIKYHLKAADIVAAAKDVVLFISIECKSH